LRIVKTAILITILLSLSGGIFAQEKSEPVQVDAFGKPTCEDLLARTSSFYYQLSQNPSSTGLVIIRPDKNSPKDALFYKNAIMSTWKLSGFDSSKIRIVRGTDSSFGIEITFWLVPPGSQVPESASADWPGERITSQKSFVYGTSFTGEMCPSFLAENYANLIKSNSKIKALVVIHPYNSATKWTLATEWRKILVEMYHIPLRQIRIFFSKPARDERVEFWVVPPNT